MEKTHKFRHFEVPEHIKQEFKANHGYELYSDEKRLYLSSHTKHHGERFVPDVGDYKIKFRYKPVDMEITIVAVQEGS